MAQSLKDMEILTDLAIKTAKEAWEKSFGQEEGSLPPEVMAAKVKAVGKIAAEILKYWLKEGIGPNDLEKKDK